MRRVYTLFMTRHRPQRARARLALTTLAALALTSACGAIAPAEGETDSGDGGSVPDEVAAAFEASCGKNGCHAGASPSAGLSLTGNSIANAIDAPSNGSSLPLITVGDISQSYIALKMVDDATIAKLKDSGALDAGFERSGDRMPLDGDFTNLNNATILGWIAGAEFPDPMGGTGGETTGGETTGDTNGLPDPTDGDLTFAEFVYDPIIMPNCSCHVNGGFAAGSLDLGASAAEAYAAIVDVMSSSGKPYIDSTGDLDNSYLIDRINGTPSIMPQGGPMDQELITRVEDWVTAGALE